LRFLGHPSGLAERGEQLAGAGHQPAGVRDALPTIITLPSRVHPADANALKPDLEARLACHPSRVPPSELVERDAELRAIDDGLRGAREGAGGLVVVEGPAGIGKTRLIREARQRASLQRMP